MVITLIFKWTSFRNHFILSVVDTGNQNEIFHPKMAEEPDAQSIDQERLGTVVI